jgi:hypothetical protein
MDTKPYLKYLDKEMTIMGILSAASVAAPAGILGTIATKGGSLTTALWNAGPLFIVAASALCVAAASCFYKERSQLAWLYGQICLTEALNENGAVTAQLREWLRKADSWESWWPYSWGFTFLVTGVVEYLFAFFFLLIPPRWSWLSAHVHPFKLWCFNGCAAVAVLTLALQYYVLTRYKFSDHYWGDFWSNSVKFLLRRSR